MYLSQVRTASCAATACVNSFGDEQLAVDLVADKLLFEALKYSVSDRSTSGQPGAIEFHAGGTWGVCAARRLPRMCTPAHLHVTHSGSHTMLNALA